MAWRLAGYCPHSGPNGENYLGSLRHRNKTAVTGEDRWPIDRRQMVPRRQRYGCRAVVSVEGIWGDKEGTAGFAAERGNDCFNLSVAVNGRCDWHNIE